MIFYSDFMHEEMAVVQKWVSFFYCKKKWETNFGNHFGHPTFPTPTTRKPNKKYLVSFYAYIAIIVNLHNLKWCSQLFVHCFLIGNFVKYRL